MTTRGLDEEEEQSLIYTCANRCGQESLFPCSCGALCVVYDTCCEKFYQDCPHIVQDARSRFGDLISSSKICKSDLFLISSCPSQSEPQAHGMDTDDLGRTDLGKEVVSEASAIVRFQHTTKAGPLTTSVTMKSPLESMARRLMNAALGAPVTDASSGITYTNKTIYECHTHKEDKFFVWSLQLNYVYANPQSLEDLKYLKDLDSYEPPFNSAVLSRHFCMANLVETCPATWHPQKGEEHFDTKCSEFFSLTSLSGIAYLLYRNRFCAYCNEGKNQTFVLRDSVSTAPRGYQLRMVMTINQLGHYSIKVMHPDFVEDIIVPWSTVSCKLVSKSSQDLVQGKLSSISSDDRSVCSVKCSSSVFTLSQDGYCKGPGLAQVAVSDDGLPPLCPVVLQHLATFISCGLQSMIKSMPHAEFQRPVISVQTDTKTLKSLYIVELAVHTPMQYRNFFASTDEEGITNWRHLEVLAKSLKHYRRSHDLCTASDSSKDKSNRKQVTPLPFEERLGTSQSMNKSFNLLEERVGPVVDTHNVTTLCMTAINSPQYYEDAVLICRKAVVYTQDADAIADFLDSPCFSHLEKMRLERNTGRNILNNTEGSLHKIWILVAGVAVVVVAKRQD
ncbi:hypothetical protein EGW08_015449 [Elysia chlorotica]|uniref:SMB domain-containing protein n=1 Tax=Elysia chlorotica TaxID=188477 RepID=A0A433T5K7_ELYCH|nr:hypothetical protein EGW08_015449 [Elysia chlorotica]